MELPEPDAYRRHSAEGRRFRLPDTSLRLRLRRRSSSSSSSSLSLSLSRNRSLREVAFRVLTSLCLASTACLFLFGPIAGWVCAVSSGPGFMGRFCFKNRVQECPFHFGFPSPTQSSLYSIIRFYFLSFFQ